MRKLAFACPLLLLALVAASCALPSGSGDPESKAGGAPGEPRAGDVDAGVELRTVGMPPQASPAKGHYYRLRLVKIIDAQGFGQPLEVLRLLLPPDWSTKGGLQWVNGQVGCPANIVQLAFQASSPDGLSGLELMPSAVWASASDPMTMQILQQAAQNGTGCPVGPPIDAAGYLRQMLLPRARLGAELLAIEPLAAVAEAKRKAIAPVLQQMTASGNLRSYQLDASSAHVGYQIGGQPVEEWLSVTLTSLTMPSINPAGLLQGQVALNASYTMTATEGVVGLRAPRGHFDPQLAATIVASIRPNPVYQAALTKVQNNINNIAIRGAMERARIWREASMEISKTINEAYQNQQAVQDRAAGQFSQAIRGVETYRNPATGEDVELTGGYDSAWISPQGVYLLSDTPGFNPAVAFREDWTRLDRQSQ